MTDKEFFEQNGFAQEGNYPDLTLSKRYIDSALLVSVEPMWGGFKITYTCGILHNGALFNGVIYSGAATAKEAIEKIEEFANRMKI